MKEKLEAYLGESGMDRSATIAADAIPFDPSLVTLCAQNACGNYGQCWTCPPLCGTPEQLRAEIVTYAHATVFQKVYAIEDSFDIEGMNAAGADFKRRCGTIAATVKTMLPSCRFLTAGGCRECPRCAARDHELCRFPDRAYLSLEACGIHVSALAEVCGMRYINGVNTVTYFGAVIWNDTV